MAKSRKSGYKRPIEAYQHKDKRRANNPPVGLVTPETDPDVGKNKTYAYDAHLDPQLLWAGKTEHTSFEVPTVSLHVHERIDPRTIIEAVRKHNGNGGGQLPLFAQPDENPPLRQAVEFYKHAHGWSNRLIAGDSLLVMNSLLEKEGLAGKVQMIYIDPPYGIRYGSNFQPFVNKKDVKDGKDEDLTAEPEQIRAFRDTWELGIHSYLTYLRDRLLLARELLAEDGSVFVQIGDENVQWVRALVDEVFGPTNFMSLISFRTKIPLNAAHLPNIADYLIWHAKDKSRIKFRRQFLPRDFGVDTLFSNALLPNGQVVNAGEIPDEDRKNTRYFSLIDLMASGYTESCHFEFYLNGKRAYPNPTTSWKTTPEGMKRLLAAGRVRWLKTVPRYVFFADDYPVMEITNQWTDTQGASGKIYAVQTATKIIERCVLMTTDPGDLVFDPTCGSGTTAFVAEQWGRRWMTCDTSRVALTLARQRLMTAIFDYYELAHKEEGVSSGFKYKTVRHVTLGSIANNAEIDNIHARWQTQLESVRARLNRLLKQSLEEWELPREAKTGWPAEAKHLLADWWELRQKCQREIDTAIASLAAEETLYNQALPDREKVRVSGPFTVEAVPAPTAKSIEEVLENSPQPADISISRSGETLRQGEWRDELLRVGIRGKAGQHISFVRLEPLPGCRWLHADGETSSVGDGVVKARKDLQARNSVRVVVSFGPEHAPMEGRQVAQAIEEAQTLVPKPKIIVFAAFQFDPEAAKDIDETNWPGVTLLKAQMNADLLTDDLKKKHASNESFWLIGQPDVSLHRVAKGEEKGKWRVVVEGFDYYNTKTGALESGGSERIAAWMLDTDYDGRSLYPRQVFFPMADENEGWAKLTHNLKAEIDKEKIEAYRSIESIPFEAGEHKRVAVKIVDDRGIESLKVLELD